MCTQSWPNYHMFIMMKQLGQAYLKYGNSNLPRDKSHSFLSSWLHSQFTYSPYNVYLAKVGKNNIDACILPIPTVEKIPTQALNDFALHCSYLL